MNVDMIGQTPDHIISSLIDDDDDDDIVVCDMNGRSHSTASLTIPHNPTTQNRPVQEVLPNQICKPSALPPTESVVQQLQQLQQGTQGLLSRFKDLKNAQCSGTSTNMEAQPTSVLQKHDHESYPWSHHDVEAPEPVKNAGAAWTKLKTLRIAQLAKENLTTELSFTPYEDMDMAPPAFTSPRVEKLFVGGLRYEMDEVLIARVLSFFGGTYIPPSHVEIFRRGDRPTGCAAIYLTSHEAADVLLSFTRQLLCEEYGVRHVENTAELREYAQILSAEMQGPRHPLVIEVPRDGSRRLSQSSRYHKDHKNEDDHFPVSRKHRPSPDPQPPLQNEIVEVKESQRPKQPSQPLASTTTTTTVSPTPPPQVMPTKVQTIIPPLPQQAQTIYYTPSGQQVIYYTAPQTAVNHNGTPTMYATNGMGGMYPVVMMPVQTSPYTVQYVQTTQQPYWQQQPQILVQPQSQNVVFQVASTPNE